MKLVNTRTLVLGAVSIALAACGDDVTVVTPPPNITLNPASVTCPAGSATAVGVTVTGGSGTPTVAFASNNTNITVTGAGSGATVNCTTVGSSVITVTVTSGGQTVTGSIPVTVTAPIQVIQGIQITPQTATIAINATQTFTATVIASQTGANTAARFTSSAPAIATVDSVTGVVTGRSAGTATIVARSVQAPNIQAAATVTVVSGAAFVTSLVVQPATVAIQTGATQQLAANVTLAPGAPANTSRAVNYVSSDTSVATVSSTGLITGRRNGTANITVTSQAAPEITQIVAVTVRDPLQVRVTIQSITFTNAAGVQQPIQESQAVGGPLTATLNVDPGDATLTRVDCLLNGVVIDSQLFSAALAEAARLARQTGSADVQPIQCRLNTAAFDSVTGTGRFLNGQGIFSGRVIGRLGNGQTQQLATVGADFTIFNQGGFAILGITNTPTATQRALEADASGPGQEFGPDGRIWRAGSFTVRLRPIVFTAIPGTTRPDTVASFAVVLQRGDNGATVVTRAAVRDSVGTGFSVTFPGGTNNLAAFTNTFQPANQLNGYTTASANGDFFSAASVVGGGAAFANNFGGPNPAVGTYYDNRGIILSLEQRRVFVDNTSPVAPSGFNIPRAQFRPASGGFTAGFINNAFVFADSLAPFYNVGGVITRNNPDNGGVDRVRNQFFVVPQSGLVGTPAGAGDIVTVGVNPITTGANVPAARFNNTYRAAVRLVDALGNSANVNVTDAQNGDAIVTFGVDITAPTLQIDEAGSGVLALNYRNSSSADPLLTRGRFNASNRDRATVSFIPVDDIGFGTQSVLASVTRIVRQGPDDPSRPQQVQCLNLNANQQLVYSSTGALGVADCSTVLVNLPNQFNLNTLGQPTVASQQAAEYIVSARARDEGGNLSDATRVVASIDPIVPAIGGVSFPPAIAGGNSVTFQTAATDNLELAEAFAYINYPTSQTTRLVLRYDAPPVGTLYDNTLVNFANPLNLTVGTFIRSMQLSDAAGNLGVTNAASDVIVSVADAGLNVATNRGFIAPNVGQPANFTTNDPTSNVQRYIINPPTFNGSGAITAPLSVTVVGAQGSLLNPFQRIDLWVEDVTPGTARADLSADLPGDLLPQISLRPVVTGQAFAGATTDANAAFPGLRTVTFVFPNSVLEQFRGAGPRTFRVIGVSATGGGLTSPGVEITVP